MVLTKSMLKHFSKEANTPENKILRNAITQNGINSVALNRDVVNSLHYTFSKEIKTGKITNQENSGRCWLFAGLNLFRQRVSSKYNIKNFELSQSYLMFWDKLEKSNYFLENIIKTRKEDKQSRLLMWLLRDPVQDGGQWDMFVSLVQKYGVVPKYVMPETYHSKKSYHMNNVLTLKLRADAAVLRRMHERGKSEKALKKKKEEMLGEIYQMLVRFFGIPRDSFDFEYTDKKKKFHFDRDLTPKKFFKKYVGLELNDFVSLVNAPTKDKPFDRTYTVKYLGNVMEGRKILYLNVDSKTFKKATLGQLKEDLPVWFGCDVVKMMDSDSGLMDKNLFMYDDALGVETKLDKGERLDYGESQLTHAMLFTGVNLVKGKPNRWKVENSWGKDKGDKGYFVMSDDWFDEYNYQVIVKEKYLPAKAKKALKKKPIELPPWDPLGSLAPMR